MIKRWLTLAAVAVVLTGCYHQTTSTPPQTQSETPALTEDSVEIKNFVFSPATITVKNKDIPDHSLTSDDGKSFDTKLIAQGKSATITAPTAPGSYSFHCTPHPYMKGTLVVHE